MELRAAIDRNFAEVNNAILKLRAYNELSKAELRYVRMSFFVIAQQAIYNDMIASAIRVLDKRPDVASVWSIMQADEAVADSALQASGLTVSGLDATRLKLRHIRNKTHFHIDATLVATPEAVWETANLSGGEFSRVVASLASFLSAMKVHFFGGEPLVVTPYDGSDIPKIVSAYEGVHGAIHGV